MGKRKIGKITLGICQTNCYFVYEEGKQEVMLFDPADNGEYIYEGLKSKGFSVAAILLTHGHFDHIWGVERLKELSRAEVYAYEAERKVCGSDILNVSKECGRSCRLSADVYLKDGQEISAAGISCRLIATPGHTEGSCCYYFEEDAILISGDTLFEESVGRTDFPTGSMSALVRSVKEKLMILPEDVKVYPGHGEATTIGHEKRYNPFL